MAVKKEIITKRKTQNRGQAAAAIATRMTQSGGIDAEILQRDTGGDE